MSEHHDVPVADGESVVAVHHVAPSDEWFVCCHGFRSDKSGSYEARCRRAVEAGYNAVRFDFRGCGQADGAFSEQTLSDKLDDLAAVVDYFDPSGYSLFGSSFGGKVAFHAATGDDRVEAVATRAPVTYNRCLEHYRSAVRRDGAYRFEDGTSIGRPFFDDLDEYPFDDVVTSLDVPVAIFHGADDESVAFEYSIRATEALEADVLLEKFRDEGHRFTPESERRMQKRLFDWLDTT